MLPRTFKTRLLEILHEAEDVGRWPTQLKVNLVSLVPKGTAVLAGQLRRIGLLPYIYRIWMFLRKALTKEWKQKLYGKQPQASGCGTNCVDSQS